jgi:ketosteroid isomerase-like protein
VAVDAAAVARAYLASFAAGDADAIAAFVSAGFVNEHHSALGSGSVGRDEYRRRLPGFLASFPGLRYDVGDVVADASRAAVTYRLRATVDGHEIDLPGVMVLAVAADGSITHRTDYWDSLTYLRQSGQA